MSKVIVVAPWLEGGGAQKALEGLLRRLPTANVHVVVLFEGSRDYQSLVDTGVEMTKLEFPRSVLGALKAARAVRPYLESAVRVLSLMRASHVVIGLSGLAPSLSGKLVCSIHQMPWVDSIGIKGVVEDIFQRRTLRHAVVVTSPSSAALQYLVSKKAVSAEQAVVENNLLQLDSTAAYPAVFHPASPLKLVFCGRLEAQKGLDILLGTLRSVSRPVYLTIAGNGSEELSLRAMADDLGDSIHRIEFRGFVSDVRPLIDESHLAVMPSRSELQPAFVWESWARGRAIISSSIRAFEDLSVEGPVHMFSGSAELITILEGADSSSAEYSGDFDSAIRAAELDVVNSSLVDFLSGKRLSAWL